MPIGHRHRWFSKPNLNVFADAYPEMLKVMRNVLPHTKIVCATLMETFIRDKAYFRFPYDFGDGEPLSAYNTVIRNACRRAKVPLADLSGLNIIYETLDGAHATRKGHRMIAEGWLRELHRLWGIETHTTPPIN